MATSDDFIELGGVKIDPPEKNILGEIVGQIPNGGLLFDEDHNENLDPDHPAYSRFCEYLGSYFFGSDLAVQTRLPQVQCLVTQIKNGRHRDTLIAWLKVQSGSRQANKTEKMADNEAEKMVDMVLHLLFMVRFGRVSHDTAKLTANGGYEFWRPGTGVMTYIATRPPFKYSRRRRRALHGVRFPKELDAWQLEKATGIKITFTNYLNDHLLLSENDTELLVFHQVSFLEHHRHQPDPLFPPGFASETLKTIALLFPEAEYSRSGRRAGWFRKALQAREQRRDQALVVDGRLTRCGNVPSRARNLVTGFRFWGPRLKALKEAYDEATPSTLAQWWYDRRNGVTWYNFWVAIWVFIVATFLGLLQCIESGLQVYKAFSPSR